MMMIRGLATRTLRNSRTVRAFSTEERCDPSLVVFDKDGTLIDFNLMWGGWVETQAWKLEMTANIPVREKLFEVMGYDWIKRSVKSQGALCCTPMGELHNLAVKLLIDEGLSKELAVNYIDQVWTLPDAVSLSRPLGDVHGIFQTIKKMNMKIGICTTDNRDSTIETLEHMGIMDMVDGMSCGDDGLPSKPAAEQIWTICNEVGVAPHNTIMVGDTDTDMLLGRNSGCGLSIGVLGGASSLEDLAVNADILVPDLHKVIKVLFQYGQQAKRFQ